MMPSKASWFLLCLFTFSISTFAQNSGTVRGTAMPNPSGKTEGGEIFRLSTIGDSIISVSPPTTAPAKYGIYLGFGAMAKASVNAEVSNGTKTEVAFPTTPDYYLSLFVPFYTQGAVGFGFNGGYSFYSYVTKPESGANNANSIKYQYSYLSLFPYLNLGNQFVGFTFGASFLSSPELSSRDLDGKETDDAKNLKDNNQPVNVVEGRLGMYFIVADGSFGRLNINLMSGFILDEQHTKSIGDKNPQPVSLSLGMSFLFKIPFQ